MNPYEFGSTFSAMGISFIADNVILAIILLEHGKDIDKKALLTLEEYPCVLENMYLRNASDLVMSDHDYLFVRNDSWFSKTVWQINSLAKQREKTIKEIIEETCQTVRDILFHGFGHVTVEEVKLVLAVSEIISRETLVFVEEYHRTGHC